MTQSGFFERKRPSTLGFAVVLALHGAVFAALILIKGPGIVPVTFPPTDTYWVPPEPVPDPVVEPRLEQPRDQRSRIETTTTPVDRPDDRQVVSDPVPEPRWDPGPVGRDPVSNPPADPPPSPVRREAEVDPRFARDLQPPYPPSEERAENEGDVRIRVTIAPSGRVIAVRRLAATSEAFWRATERQALDRWRFRPATLDGRPVEGVKVMTVHFRLRDR